jgi:hypothetical protein
MEHNMELTLKDMAGNIYFTSRIEVDEDGYPMIVDQPTWNGNDTNNNALYGDCENAVVALYEGGSTSGTMEDFIDDDCMQTVERGTWEITGDTSEFTRSTF